MSQVSKHSVELAEMVVEAEIFPAILSSLRDPDDYVIKNVATLIREIAKHSPEVWKERERERNEIITVGSRLSEEHGTKGCSCN